MNVVVTGGAGVLGAATVARLASDRSTGIAAYDRTPAPRVGVVDLLEAGPTLRWPDETDAVIHLAGTWAAPEPTADGLERHLRTNVETTAWALAACGPRVKRFVYVSSMSVYGADAVAPFRETSPVRPDSFYGRTKWLGEEVCRVAAEARPELTVVVLRLSQVYGPGTPPTVVLYDFIAQAAKAGAIAARCGADLLRDHLYVTDAADAVVAALAAPAGTFNVGCGRGQTMGEVAAAVRDASGRPIPVSFGGAPGVAKALDASAFQAATGFAPRTSLVEGVRREFVRLAAPR